MRISIIGDCSGLDSGGRQIHERLNLQFQNQQQSQGIINQARSTFSNRLRESLGNDVDLESFNMTYRYELEKRTFNCTVNLIIRGPVTVNGSRYVVRSQWRWVNASGDCEFSHQQNRYRFNFADMMGLDLSRFKVPLQNWDRVWDRNRNMTRYSLTVPPYRVQTRFGEIVIDPTQEIDTPGETYALDDVIQSGEVPIPEFGTASMALASTLVMSLFILRKRRKGPG